MWLYDLLVVGGAATGDLFWLSRAQIRLLLSEGQMSDHEGAALMLRALPRAGELIGDHGYDSDDFRSALLTRRIRPCIPLRKNRRVQHPYCRTLYRQRHKIKNMFSRLKASGGR